MIVEDDKTNQMIMSSLLKEMGVSVTLADNGKEAMSKSRVNRYDMILMDLQMPVMNGFEATKSIRSIGDQYYRTVPIVALTSSIMSNVIDKVLEAGMNGFMSKTFDSSEIYTKMTKYLKIKPEAAIEREEKTVGHKTVKTNVTDYEIEDPLSSMESLSRGDENFKKELAKLYIDNIEELKEKYLEAVINKQEEVAGKVAHKVKFTLESLRADALIALVAKGKQVITYEDSDSLTVFSNDFMKASDNLISALKKV